MVPALAAVGLPLLASGLKTLGGIAQTAFSGQKKAERALDKSIEAIPEYTPSPSILKIYDETRRKYGVPIEQSAFYQRAQRNIRRRQAQGIASLQDRRSGLLGIQGITRAAEDIGLGIDEAAEKEKERRFGQYMQASQMKAGQEAAAEQRKLLKQQQRIYAAQAKAVGRAAVKRAGLSNIFSGLTDIAKLGMEKEGD